MYLTGMSLSRLITSIQSQRKDELFHESQLVRSLIRADLPLLKNSQLAIITM
jgi:hypothetical protein